MKKQLLITIITLFSIACSPVIEKKIYNQGINIIPVPMELTQSEGAFTLKKSTAIAVSSPDFAPVAAYLAAKIKGSTGYDLQIVQQSNPDNAIVLELDTRVPVGMEGYLLNSTPTGVVIRARTPQGIFYGVQTLLQLLPAEIESPEPIKGIEWSLPVVSIKDEPRFVYRGLMLDVARHFNSVEFIKKQLDVLAMFKINRFHWHLTEDQLWTIEIKQYPKLTQIGSQRVEGDGTTHGGFYTQEQIKEVVSYAAERFIDVIPEIELPGHALAALSAYPEYSCTGGPFKNRIIWGVESDVYCAGNEATMQFVENIISEVAALFPSQYFHIGGDECPKERWEKCPKCQAKARELGLKMKIDSTGKRHSVEEQLQSHFIKRIAKHLAGLGKQMIGWDEILEGGLAPDAIVMSWRGVAGGIEAAKQGHQVIMTPGSGGMYIDHYQGAPEVEPVTIGGNANLKKTYSYDPIPVDLPQDKQQYILGAQCNMWTEYDKSADVVEYMIYPRILALAELTWSQASHRDWDSFSQRVNNAYARLDYHQINYHIPLPEGTVTQNVVFTGDSITVPFSNTRDLPMVYTIDGSEPNSSSAQYSGPITVTSDATIKIATLLQTGKISTSRSVEVQKQTLSPAVTPQVNPENDKLIMTPGLTRGQGAVVRTADGLFLSPEDYSKAQFGDPKAIKQFWGDGSNNQEYDMNRPSLSVYEGYIELPEDGVYTFASDMDELWIDGAKLIDNPNMSRHKNKKYQKALAAGKHSYRMLFNNRIKDGWPTIWTEIGFSYQLPSGGDYKKVTSEMLTY